MKPTGASDYISFYNLTRIVCKESSVAAAMTQVSGSNSVRSGENSELEIVLKDAKGNRQATGGDTVTASIVGKLKNNLITSLGIVDL